MRSFRPNGASVNVRYRKALPYDAAALAGVHVRSWHETYTGLLPQRLIDARSLEKRTAQWVEVLSDHRGDGVIVAESTEGIAGFIWIGPPGSANATQGFDAYIHALYILTAAHRQGVGRKLLRLGAEKLRNDGLRSLSVHVLSTNPARQFYEHLGAHFIAEETLDAGDDSWTQCVYGWNDITPLIHG
jgi:ribosomal protein S18 acetylase RimI-like enzyme